MRKCWIVALAAVGLVTACSPTNTSSTIVPGPPLNFVGNATCPTDNTKPYNDGYAPNTNGPAVGQAIDEMPHTHVAPPAAVTYQHNPPTSGCHYSVAATAKSLPAPIQPGAYNQPVPDEYWVHNMEHGYVVILYNCPTGCTTQFDQLHSWYKSLAPDPQLNSQCAATFGLSAPYPKVLILPNTTMAPKFAALSWDWYDPMPNGLDMNEVTRFYNNHTDQAPEGTGVC